MTILSSSDNDGEEIKEEDSTDPGQLESHWESVECPKSYFLSLVIMSAAPQPDALSTPRHRHVELPHKTMDTVPLKRGFSQVSQDKQLSEKEEHGAKHGTKSLRTTLGDSEQDSEQIAPFGISLMSHNALEALNAFEEQLSCDMCAGILLKVRLSSKKGGLTDIQPVALDGCGHTYCGSCVRQWIQVYL